MTNEGKLDRGDGLELAWARTEGRPPTVVFLTGFRSDMTGDKATFLERFCRHSGQAMLRFDYSGHGVSGGRFEDGTIGAWASDALTITEKLTHGPLILVGSSMGGWIALLTARSRPERVAGLIGIAAAPDFTERLMWNAMAPAEREQLMRDGVLNVPSEYGGAYPITRALIEDGRRHLLLEGAIDFPCPVRLLHGQRDPDVPWETALAVADRLTSQDVQTILVKDGDHRLSRPQDLQLLQTTLTSLVESCGVNPSSAKGASPTS